LGKSIDDFLKEIPEIHLHQELLRYQKTTKSGVKTMRVDEGVLNTETIFKRLINNLCIRCGKAKEKGEFLLCRGCKKQNNSKVKENCG
jgi:hypothetical protein